MRLFLTTLYLFFLWHSAPLTAQSPFRLRPAADYTITGGAIGLTAANHFLWTKKIPGLTEVELNALDPFRIPAYDRWAIHRYDLSAKKMSDIILLGTMASPALLMFDPDIRSDYYTTGVMYAETMLLTQLTTSAVKQLVLRPRPLAYNNQVPLEKKMSEDARFAFFSGHVSLTAASAFFSARVFADHHPESKLRPWIWTAAAAIPAVTGYLRIRAGKHYLTDVIVGYIVGTGVGLLVPKLHRS